MNIYTEIVNNIENNDILFKNINTFACTWFLGYKRAGCSLCRIFDKIFKFIILSLKSNILICNY